MTQECGKLEISVYVHGGVRELRSNVPCSFPREQQGSSGSCKIHKEHRVPGKESVQVIEPLGSQPRLINSNDCALHTPSGGHIEVPSCERSSIGPAVGKSQWAALSCQQLTGDPQLQRVATNQTRVSQNNPHPLRDMGV